MVIAVDGDLAGAEKGAEAFIAARMTGSDFQD
jgi:hypothetical protein